MGRFDGSFLCCKYDNNPLTPPPPPPFPLFGNQTWLDIFTFAQYEHE